jgi:hypothetical protein
MWGYQTLKIKVCQLQLVDGSSTQSDKEVAAELNRYFASVFVKDIVGDDSFPVSPVEVFPQLNPETEVISFEEDIVRAKLLKLHENKSQGPDRMHRMVLKQCAELAKLFFANIQGILLLEASCNN